MSNHWKRKFANAFRGIYLGMNGQSSFCVHVPIAMGVMLLAFVLRCAAWQWCVLMMCIALVVSLELLNSSIESLAKGLCQEHNEHVGRALDIASGAVLVASLFAALIGLSIFALQIVAW